MVSLSLSPALAAANQAGHTTRLTNPSIKKPFYPLYVFEMLLQVRVGKIEFLMMMQHQHHHLMSSFIPGFV